MVQSVSGQGGSSRRLGVLDFEVELWAIQPDILIVNERAVRRRNVSCANRWGSSICAAARTVSLPGKRSTTVLRNARRIPHHRVAGGWPTSLCLHILSGAYHNFAGTDD